ncbi:MAG: acyltransferase [Rickettsiales bacterium]
MKARMVNPDFRYKPFGILRFVLALMVLAQHFAADISPHAIHNALYPWAVGNVALLGFFILSGFIISEAYHFNYNVRPVAYIKNRFLRIVPGYWAALTLSLMVHWFLLQKLGQLWSLDKLSITTIHFGFNNLWQNFLSIIPPVKVNVTEDEYPFIPYAWALQTEMMFYITVFFVGLLYPTAKKIINMPQGYYMSLAAFAGIAAASLVQLGYLPKQLAYGSYFAFGGSLFFVIQGYRKAWIVLIPALAQMLWHFSTYEADAFQVIPANRPGQFLLLGLILLAVWILATIKVENVKVDKWFGDLSYPLYLNHYVIAVVILNVATGFSIVWLVGGLIASLALTWVMYVLIERPLLSLRKKVREKK